MQIPRFKAGGRAFAHISQHYPELVALRRDLHAHPELGFEEVYTGARVKEALKVCGVDEIHDGIGRTGIVAVIRGRSLIINLPGKPSAIDDCLQAVFPAVPYCIDLIEGAWLESDPAVCKVFRPAHAKKTSA